MKVVLLAGASSIHTVRWANGLNSAGVEVFVISQHPLLVPMDHGITVHILNTKGSLGYFLMVPAVKKLLAEIKPDLVNAHYASGYGTTARLVNFHPWLLSVWGSDVYDFPYVSPLHKYLVKRNIICSDSVASTSHCMAVQTNSLLKKARKIFITPFGVDSQKYKMCIQQQIELERDDIVIGTVKTMADKYGIDTLIQSFSLLVCHFKKTSPEIAKRLKLRLVGGGPKLEELKLLAKKEGVDKLTEFVGPVEHTKVIEELLKLDVYVALSRLDSESFGVAIIEAGAAARPVVVSDVGGLPEVVIDNVTGFVVPKENPQAAADAIKKLILNEKIRVNMGLAAQKHVENHYDWNICVKNMKNVYEEVISNAQN